MIRRRVVEVAEADVSRDAKKVAKAEVGKLAPEHNAVQPFVLLPSELQWMIIDLLPTGR